MNKYRFERMTMMAILVVSDSLKKHRELANKYGYAPHLKAKLTNANKLLDKMITRLSGVAPKVFESEVGSFKNKLYENMEFGTGDRYDIEAVTLLPDDYKMNLISLVTVDNFIENKCKRTVDRYFDKEYKTYRKYMDGFQEFLKEEILI